MPDRGRATCSLCAAERLWPCCGNPCASQRTANSLRKCIAILQLQVRKRRNIAFASHAGLNSSVNWYAAEPLTVLALVIAAGILLLFTRPPGVLGSVAAAWTVAGALLAFGIQTTMLFVGYRFLFLGSTEHREAGGTLGLVGGLVLIAAGIVALINNMRTQRS